MSLKILYQIPCLKSSFEAKKCQIVNFLLKNKTIELIIWKKTSSETKVCLIYSYVIRESFEIFFQLVWAKKKFFSSLHLRKYKFRGSHIRALALSRLENFLSSLGFPFAWPESSTNKHKKKMRIYFSRWEQKVIKNIKGGTSQFSREKSENIFSPQTWRKQARNGTSSYA